MSVHQVHVPVFRDRIERKYQLGVKDSEVANLWREIGSVLAPYGMVPVQEITSVGSVYFGNKDHDRCLPAEKPECEKKIITLRCNPGGIDGRPHLPRSY